uniref:Uncharacterized protein n=1 Tax=Triticum urartu TaxID=4572 RepID=A0A8R7VAW0_TRIUA
MVPPILAAGHLLLCWLPPKLSYLGCFLEVGTHRQARGPTCCCWCL